MNIQLIIDQTMLSSHERENYHLKHTEKININIIYNCNELMKKLEEFADIYYETTNTRLIIIGNQSTFLLAKNTLSDKDIPFGFISNYRDETYIQKTINDIKKMEQPILTKVINYHEQITGREGLCHFIKFGKQAQIIRFKRQLNIFELKKIKNSLKKIVEQLPKYYRHYAIEIFTKGQFQSYNHIVSGNIVINKNKAELQLSMTKNYFQDQSWFYTPKRYRNLITENKLRIIANSPVVLAFDQTILPAQPIDLQLTCQTIMMWN